MAQRAAGVALLGASQGSARPQIVIRCGSILERKSSGYCA